MYALTQKEPTYSNPDWVTQMDKNFEQLMAEDAAAKKAKTLLGRVIAHGWADGAAYYQIIKVNPKTVRIRVCRDIGDDWILPAWGRERTISISDARRFL